MSGAPHGSDAPEGLIRDGDHAREGVPRGRFHRLCLLPVGRHHASRRYDYQRQDRPEPPAQHKQDLQERARQSCTGVLSSILLLLHDFQSLGSRYV